VAALREDDFSFRARGAENDDALGDLSREINLLAATLQQQKLSAIEATALLQRVVASVDAPLFAFDSDHVLRLTNPAAARLLAQNEVAMLGRTAEQIGAEQIFNAETDSIVTLSVAGRPTRWMVGRSAFRQQGKPHQLVLLSDVSAALRREERSAWQRLIRVFGHEVNNSLAPIKSIAGSLRMRLDQASSEREDFDRGLGVIENRAESLNRFLQSYRQLSQLPSPTRSSVALKPIMERIVQLETRLGVNLIGGADIRVDIDRDQVEQMLINLLRNAVEAAFENVATSEPQVSASWSVVNSEACISIVDNGPGLTNPANLFVPFYTTKSGGSGIGLVIARQVVEAHGGSVKLANRKDARGCEVQVRLPLASGRLV
jgi:two-component system, NtrC family, nitrogen regulation sensor histidine kinase NtrY